MRKLLLTTLLVAGVALLAWYPSQAQAQVSGACYLCHTMHNSQDGGIPTGGQATPQPHLTLNTCIGCHSSGGVAGAPKVDGAYGVANGTTAGGTFADSGTAGQYCADDTCVHNVNLTGVLPVLGTDDTFSGGTVPGSGGAGMNGGVGSTDPANLVCAGSNGCHGDTSIAGNDAGIQGFHHHAKTGWRYLQIAGTATPVEGVGASDWELSLSDGYTAGEEHNVYSSSTTAGISKLCANCHPSFYGTANTQDGSSNWIKHPTDADLPAGWTPTVDYVNNPFAFADLTDKTADGTYDATNAQVSCVSCHRAHGTPYSDILRWDYDTQTAGGGATYGCLGCHNNQR